ncbi:hypothetical protein DFS34DRAFT_612644 [Phlyctochytrium arcticum]|nr:hypothetical protein DFS34DRAFT_612644 [Phlyctochytrium arcticum]
MTTVIYTSEAPKEALEAHIFIGDRSLFASALSSASLPDDLVQIFTDIKQDVVSGWKKEGDKRVQYVLAHLSKDKSRHMGVVRSDLVHDIVASQVPKEGNAKVTLVLESQEQVLPAGYAVSRAFSLYSRKSSVAKYKPRTVYVDVLVKGDVTKEVYAKLNAVGKSIRTAARLVDTPCGDLHVAAYVDEVKALIKDLPNVKGEFIIGEDLKAKGLGAIYGVGKAAEHPACLAILSYTPTSPTVEHRPVFVGKGIVYDTGGLSLKSGPNMCGMKDDMGGSAACLGAFLAAVENKYPGPLSVVLCIAENAIGHKAQRPDDIVLAYSGKTIELNNTDAEGRLVLADGVAWATKNMSPTHVVDIATLTGAQLITTGKKHAGVLSRSDEGEKIVMAAGQATGDWCFPFLYAPELLKKEFDSKVADMKNSVADRMNAQASCAGHFIEDHLHADYKGEWMHIDIAGPAADKQRATGFGVALLVGILDQLKQQSKPIQA